MNNPARIVLACAAVLIALATLLGALGAHALQHRLTPERLATFEVAVRYQFLHALGLLALGVLMRSQPSALLSTSAWLVMGGVVLFSGSLYLLILGAPRMLGLVTPLGGVLMIGGWIVFAAAVLRR